MHRAGKIGRFQAEDRSGLITEFIQNRNAILNNIAKRCVVNITGYYLTLIHTSNFTLETFCFNF